MNLSGFVVIKNGVRLGYPFIESILSILPACDEFVVSEGYGDDDTYAWLQRLRETYPDKVRLYRDHWPKSSREGLAFSEMQNKVFARCRGRWAFLLQADEIMPPENLDYLRSLILPRTALDRVVGRRRYSSYLVDRLDVLDHFQTFDQTYTQRWGIRLVRKRPLVKTGGDGWSFIGLGCRLIGTAHLPRPILHLGYEFPINLLRKEINHAQFYANEMSRQPRVEQCRRELADYEAGKTPDLPRGNPLNLPPLITPLIGLAEYRVREELFEKPPR